MKVSPQKATAFFGASGIALAAWYLHAHPAGTVGSGYHSSDRAPSVADIKRSAFAQSLDVLPAPADAPLAGPARITPTMAKEVAESRKTNI